MPDSFSALLLMLVSVLAPQDHDSREEIGHSSWKTLTIANLPDDDRKLWQRYHAGKRPGVTWANNRCFNGPIQFKAEIKTSHAVLWERIVYLHKGKLRVVFGPQQITTPFVIWTASPGKTRDVVTGRRYVASGESLIIEKMESIAYQYMCYGGKRRTIITSN